MPEITVIVPVYKVESYLHRCIDSILAQTYRDFDLILIDDGSPDNCGAICDEYAKTDSRIHVIHQENGGLSAARNAGIDWAFANSDSHWLTFIDSDDWVHPKYLEALLNAAEEKGTDIALCGFMRTSGEPLPKVEDLSARLWETGAYFLEHNVNATVAWGKLYRKECFHDWRYPVGKLHEDEFITYRILFVYSRIAVIEAALYAYFQNDYGIMKSPWSLRRLDKLEALEEQISFYAQNGYYDNAKSRYRSWLSNCVHGQAAIAALPDLSDTEKAENIAALKRRMRGMLRKYSAYHWVSPLRRGDRWYYINAYPFLMALDKLWKPVKSAAKKIPGAVGMVHFVRDLPDSGQKLKKYLQAIRNTDAILLQTPLHGNLGDHAIALAENDVLHELGIRCAEYPWTKEIEKLLARFTPKRKTILIQGGGYLGSLWPNQEERLRNTLLAYKKQRVVVFPQTVYFDMNTPEGKAFFADSRSIYESHPDLTVFVRERYSYAFMKEHMPAVKTVLVPDIVMLLRPERNEEKRSGACICLRRDRERTLPDAEKNKLLSLIRADYPKLHYTDTVLDHPADMEQRESAVMGKLEEFAASELVVTDRLHGMIFAAITETPCIVVNSMSHKLRGCYEWIKTLDYIRFVEELDMIPSVIQELKRVRPKYDRTTIAGAMEPLYEELKKVL